ncbi:replication protein A 70 kDa DNA-binding subunit D-like [Nicotiana sylvestris]|uniref:replication protein A 70 kDa DNA-binding subunit D-like n=1 Tax=Nicotiana sylvestris TaxID=4096 RepID=UPI00388CBA7F
MASNYNYISEISMSKMSWNLKGDRIHATIGRAVMRIFKTKIHEMGLYVMKNFVVGPNNLKIKTSKHKLKLTFSHRRSVDEISDSQFSLNIFNFKPYEHLTNQLEVDENELFDVIGEVIDHGNIESYNQGGKTSTFMNLELEDHERNNISATFLGEFVDEILPQLDGSPNQRVIVVMQLIKAYKFQGKYSVRNTWHSSKLWINPDRPQVAEFISRLGSGREVNFERISQTTSQHSYSVFEELAVGNVEVKNIGELIDFMQNHEAIKFIGKSVDTLKEGVVETSGAAYECSHLLEIEAILNGKFMFKLTVKPSNIEEKKCLFQE